MKSYYRYRPSEVVGVITTPDCKAVYDYTGKLVFTSKLQEVGVWNVRQGNLVSILLYFSLLSFEQYFYLLSFVYIVR